MSDAEPSSRRLVLGLGNPGERYRGTRHNLGFRVVREVAGRMAVTLDRLECSALVGEADQLLLAMPQTYMNRSGYAARCLTDRHEIEAADTLVVYDDVELPLGRLRLRRGGGPGGHRGMESVIRNLRTEEIPRLRLGIRSETDEEPDDLVDFVLEPFRADEQPAVERLIERAADACQAWLELDIEAAMNRFNG
ncbi:MAG: aminoacyl-tRNA hydrolase [Thermoanaerobaculia bacterium]